MSPSGPERRLPRDSNTSEVEGQADIARTSQIGRSWTLSGPELLKSAALQLALLAPFRGSQFPAVISLVPGGREPMSSNLSERAIPK